MQKMAKNDGIIFATKLYNGRFSQKGIANRKKEEK
jgi:multimeric flavodoxin WrbA